LQASAICQSSIREAALMGYAASGQVIFLTEIATLLHPPYETMTACL